MCMSLVIIPVYCVLYAQLRVDPLENIMRFVGPLQSVMSKAHVHTFFPYIHSVHIQVCMDMHSFSDYMQFNLPQTCKMFADTKEHCLAGIRNGSPFRY